MLYPYFRQRDEAPVQAPRPVLVQAIGTEAIFHDGDRTRWADWNENLDSHRSIPLFLNGKRIAHKGWAFRRMDRFNVGQSIRELLALTNPPWQVLFPTQDAEADPDRWAAVWAAEADVAAGDWIQVATALPQLLLSWRPDPADPSSPLDVAEMGVLVSAVEWYYRRDGILVAVAAAEFLGWGPALPSQMRPPLAVLHGMVGAEGSATDAPHHQAI